MSLYTTVCILFALSVYRYPLPKRAAGDVVLTHVDDKGKSDNAIAEGRYIYVWGMSRALCYIPRAGPVYNRLTAFRHSCVDWRVTEWPHGGLISVGGAVAYAESEQLGLGTRLRWSTLLTRSDRASPPAGKLGSLQGWLVPAI